MKYRITALCLALSLALGLCLPASAARDPALETILALGIMQGDERGNLDLAQPVTRAQFATMMTRVSVYKDSIGAGPAYALFTDLPAGHWAAPYAETAVRAGWFIGYTDGSFRPDNQITLEEACTALLRLAGYGASDLSGPFPAAQLDKAALIGLRDGMTAKQGQALTRRECVDLFYNLLTVNTARGQVFASTLGYAVTGGKVDYTALVQAELQGPFLASGGDKLDFVPLRVLRNGTEVTSAALREQDVYYYNDKVRTLWIYSQTVTGTVSTLTPSANAPTAVTVDGSSYRLADPALGWQLSALNRDMRGELVTLLVGMNNEVAGILTGDQVEAGLVGSVLSVTEQADANADMTTTLRLLCTDGVTRSLPLEQDVNLDTGDLVQVTIARGSTTVSQVWDTSISGKITGTAIGTIPLAEHVEILDLSAEGTAGVPVEPERIAGKTLRAQDVRWYSLDENGALEKLILRDATGELWRYGLLTDVEDLSFGSMSVNGVYTGYLGGVESSQITTNIKYAVKEGGFAVRYDGASVADMEQLAKAQLTGLGVSSAAAGSKTYPLAPDLQFYLLSGGEYYPTDRETVLKGGYPLTGWYDTAPLGGRIRVIVAEKK